MKRVRIQPGVVDGDYDMLEIDFADGTNDLISARSAADARAWATRADQLRASLIKACKRRDAPINDRHIDGLACALAEAVLKAWSLT